MLYIIIVLHSLMVVSFTIRILIRDDLSPTSRLAWFIVIVIIPIFGSLLYFLFGEIDLGKTTKQKHAKIFADIKKQSQKILGQELDIDNLIDNDYQSAFKYIQSINGFHIVNGNHGELMQDAQIARSRIIMDIDSAKFSVNLLYYIWLDDVTGTNMAQALIRAANRGLTCRVMVDGIGSGQFVKSKLWAKMQEYGVELSIAFPVNNPLMTMIKSRIDLRNHRKITVIDGEITYCGSQNCADAEYAVKPKFAPWVDILIRFVGPVVAQNQLLFASDWMLYNDTKLDEFQMNCQYFDNGFPAQVMGDGPTERKNSSPQLFCSLIHSAKKELTISTPYFVPDDTVLGALIACAYRKVKVTIIFPQKNDSWVVSAASRSHYKRMLDSGIIIYEYTKGLLHSKTLTIDGKITFLGSSNMDLRSFNLNYENNIIFQSEQLTNDVYNRQLDYISDSVQIKLEEILKWSPLKRIWNNVIATFGPLL